MLQISEIVKKTEEMFDLFNEHFYHGELTRPAITVSPDGKITFEIHYELGVLPEVFPEAMARLTRTQFLR